MAIDPAKLRFPVSSQAEATQRWTVLAPRQRLTLWVGRNSIEPVSPINLQLRSGHPPLRNLYV